MNPTKMKFEKSSNTAHLVLREVVRKSPDEDLVVAVGDSAGDDAQDRKVELGDRPRPGAHTQAISTRTCITPC